VSRTSVLDRSFRKVSWTIFEIITFSANRATLAILKRLQNVRMNGQKPPLGSWKVSSQTQLTSPELQQLVTAADAVERADWSTER
jgi:hypothetical protein